MNETDVREEIATPMLSALGYKRGTTADILRELSLSYDREFLGRKKASDPPLRGRADYVLSVLGAGRWVFEIKGPDEPIDLDAIDQSITYARHPRVAGHYAAILNGPRFVLVSAGLPADAPPLLELDVESPEQLAAAVQGILSPVAIRRDCSPRFVDIAKPLAPHLRSTALIRSGVITHDFTDWEINHPVHPDYAAQIDDTYRRLAGQRVPITGGSIGRDETSRIAATIQWDAPHEMLVAFGRDKGLFRQQYVCLDGEISTNADAVSTFDVVGSIEVAQGEALFNIAKWAAEPAAVPGFMTYRGQAWGWLDGDAFRGDFEAEYLFTTPAAPGFEMVSYLGGRFEVLVDTR